MIVERIFCDRKKMVWAIGNADLCEQKSVHGSPVNWCVYQGRRSEIYLRNKETQQKLRVIVSIQYHASF